jgi:PKD repeat protein
MVYKTTFKNNFAMKKSFFTLVIAVLMINSSCKKEDLPEIVADFNFSVTGYAPA